MVSNSIDFCDIPYFSKEICDYISRDEKLKSFYGNTPNLEGLTTQIQHKADRLSQKQRCKISEIISEQYANTDTSTLTQTNIKKLKNSKTFTVTTGHQLNLFTGPIYVLYKIVTTINTVRFLKHQLPDYDFVPVYWMASEDHDFKEIDHFTFRGKRFSWNCRSSGAVGRFNTEGLKRVFEIFSQQLGDDPESETLKVLFKKSYLENNTLSSATRTLINELFGRYGLVIVDGDTYDLKTAFAPYIKDDLIRQSTHKIVGETNSKLSQTGYKVQVKPREINSFYLRENLRERIIRTDVGFAVNETNISWSEKEMLDEVDKHPERFSPNVLLRPLYQEVILPNICYVGGGGELAYWLQLKDLFGYYKIPFPVLMPRHSAMIVGKKQFKTIQKRNIDIRDLCLSKEDFIDKRIRKTSCIDINFTPQKNTLHQQFRTLYDIANKTDASFLGAVKAQERKQHKGLENLEKRLLKAQKKKLTDEVLRCTRLKDELFPDGVLQERVNNFSEFYLNRGEYFIPELMEYLKPFCYKFSVISED